LTAARTNQRKNVHIVLTEDERDFRLQPRKPRVAKTDNAAVAFVALMRQARQLRRVSRGALQRPHSIVHQQRCAARVLYSKSATRGQWRAHGRYIARESATAEGYQEGRVHGYGSFTQTFSVEVLSAWRCWKSFFSLLIALTSRYADSMESNRLSV
jgi:hypothetical protein